MLVVNLADDFLHHVLHGDDARGRPVLVDDHYHVGSLFLHFAHQIVHGLRLGNCTDGAHDIAHFATGALLVVKLEHIANMDKSGYLVNRSIVSRNAGELLMDH